MFIHVFKLRINQNCQAGKEKQKNTGDTDKKRTSCEKERKKWRWFEVRAAAEEEDKQKVGWEVLAENSWRNGRRECLNYKDEAPNFKRLSPPSVKTFHSSEGSHPAFSSVPPITQTWKLAKGEWPSLLLPSGLEPFSANASVLLQQFSLQWHR